MRRLCGVGAACVLWAGCGGEGAQGRVAFSQVEVQAFLEREVARTLPGLSVGAASCPATLPDKTGGTATCTVEVERATLHYDVQRLVGGRFEARPQRPIVTVGDITTAVRAKLGVATAQVGCGGALVLQPDPGQAITCEVTEAGSTSAATVQVGPTGTVNVTAT